MKTLGTLALAAAAALGTVALASAQYPPPGSAVTVTASDTTPGVGETVTLTVQVTAPTAMNIAPDGSRMILASVPKQPVLDSNVDAQQAGPPYTCTASVSGGSGATVTPSTVTTDANGAANLSVYTGTTPATLAVLVNCGTVSGQAQLLVGTGSGGGGGQVPGSPTPGGGGGSGDGGSGGSGGSGGQVPQPPSTGQGMSSSSGGTDVFWYGAAAAGILAAGASALIVRKSRA